MTKTITGYVLSPVVATVEANTLEEALKTVRAELLKPKLDIQITQIGEDIFIPNPDFYSDVMLETMKAEGADAFEMIHDEDEVAEPETERDIKITAIRCSDDGEPRMVVASSKNNEPVQIEGDVDYFRDILEAAFGPGVPQLCTGKCEKTCKDKCSKEAFPVKCKGCNGQCKCGKDTKDFKKDNCVKEGDKVKTNKVKTRKCNKNTKIKKADKLDFDAFMKLLMGQSDK